MEIQRSHGTLGTIGGTSSGFGQQSAALGKEEFLKLLTVQLSHQDPLDPMSNEAFVAQLAQFSSLEQMQNINASLQTSHLLEQSINNSLAADLIGREVRASGGAVSLDAGQPAEFYVGLASAARVSVTIRDASGAAVRTLDVGALPSGESRVLWDGTDDAGEALPSGDYRLSVEARDGAGRFVDVESATTGEVTGLRFLGGRTLLIVNGREVALEDVSEIRANDRD